MPAPRPHPSPALVEGIRRITGAVLLVALAFSQAPGRVVADTKLDLVVDPGRFLGRSLQAWDPSAAFGQLQNQAYGYLFPMGPFFWLGHVCGLPAWVVQRLWWSVLLLLAYAGFLRLARLLGIGTPTTQLVGALAYALGPRVVTELGSISVELVPLVLLPWVLTPLVSGARTGSVRKAAAWSALAVACMGGVNAAAVLAVLVLPPLFLLTRARGPRRTRLLLSWLGCLVLAVAWWFLPLLVLGRYAYPFLSYIENAGITTAATGAPNVLRGTDHWLGFLVTGGQPTFPAGHVLATTPLYVAATVLVAALGAFGLGHGRTPERRFLRWGLLVGAVLVGVGYAGAYGGPAAAAVHHLLDGPLAPFRNVHKFDPVLRLPLTLGLTAALALVPAAVARTVARLKGEDAEWLRRHPLVSVRAVGLVVLIPLFVSTAPAWTGGLAPNGSFTAIPAWWPQTADWLAAHDEGGTGGRALLEPASAFADYVWGSPQDEPLQALARSPWVVRGAVPLGAPGATRLLDGIESLVATGRSAPALAGALARAGVRFVVLRNDLAPGASTTAPAVARATLEASPGLRRVVGLGDRMPTTAGHSFDLAGPLASPQAVEIFEVLRPQGVATVLPGQPVGLSGGPEAAAGSVALDRGTPLVALADGGPDDRQLVTDTLRRRTLNFGAPVGRAYGPTLPADVDPRRGRPAADVTPYDGVDHQTTATLSGAVSVTATSSAADAFAVGWRGPSAAPTAAFDGDPSTAWVTDLAPDRPSVRVTYASPVSLAGIVLRFDGLPGGVARPAKVTVVTDSGRVTVPVDSDRVRVAASGATRSVQLLLTPTAGDDRAVGLGDVDGLPVVTPGLAVPADSAAAGPGSTWVFTRDPAGRRACVLPGAAWTCAPSLALAPGEPGPLTRTFGVGSATAAAVSVEVTAVPGPELDRLLDAAAGPVVSGSSQLVDDPADRPGAALDGDPATAWMTGPEDAAPSLTVTYRQDVTVSSLALAAPSSSSGRIVGAVVHGDAGASRVVALAGGRTTRFPPLTSRSLTITLQIVPSTSELFLEHAPLVVTDLILGGAPSAGSDPDVSVSCGDGPSIDLDGRAVRTAVTATRGQLVGGGPVAATICDSAALALTLGRHVLTAASSATFEASQVTLSAEGADQVVAGDAVPLDLRQWTAERRVVVLPAAGSASSTLALDEGFNRGWVATVSGHPLAPVRVDGWRQGWVLPPGTTGEAVLTFGPGPLHRAGLALGAVGLLGLLALALIPVRRRRNRPAPVGPGRTSIWGVVLGPVSVAVLLAGPLGLVVWWLGRLLARRRRTWAVAIAGTSLALCAALAAGRSMPGWWQAVLQGLAVSLLAVAATPERRRVSTPDGAPTRAPAAPGPATTP